MCICRLLVVFFMFFMWGSLVSVVLISVKVGLVFIGSLICWCCWLDRVVLFRCLVISYIWWMWVM